MGVVLIVGQGEREYASLGLASRAPVSSANSFLRKVAVIDFHHCGKLPKAISLEREKVQFESVSEFCSTMGPASLGLWQHIRGRACGEACLLISQLVNERNGKMLQFHGSY